MHKTEKISTFHIEEQGKKVSSPSYHTLSWVPAQLRYPDAQPGPSSAVGTVFALILCDLFGSVPTHMRVLSQIRYLTPISVLLNSNVPDMRLTKLFGTYLISFQTGSLLYLLCGLLLVIVTVRIFRRRYCWKNDSGSWIGVILDNFYVFKLTYNNRFYSVNMSILYHTKVGQKLDQKKKVSPQGSFLCVFWDVSKVRSR